MPMYDLFPVGPGRLEGVRLYVYSLLLWGWREREASHLTRHGLLSIILLATVIALDVRDC